MNCNIAANSTVPPPAPAIEVIMAVKNDNIVKIILSDKDNINTLGF
jgi:hypothetical protein